VSALVAFLLAGALAVAPTALAAQVRQAASAPYQGTLTASAMSIPNGTSITFSYSVPSAGVTSTNWVGIYEPGQTPGQVRSTTWQYTPDASGTVTFSTSSLDGVGDYVAYFLYDNGYQALGGPAPARAAQRGRLPGRGSPGLGPPVPAPAAPKRGQPADPLAVGRVRAAQGHPGGPAAGR
jgi:hypothetical protein